MKRIYFSVVFFLLAPFGVEAATFEFTSNCRQAYNYMLQLNFNSSRNYLAIEKTANPDNAAIYYIEHYCDFIQAFISEENADFLKLKNNLDKRISSIEKAEGSPWTNMATGEMLMQFAVLKLKRKEYLSSGYFIRRSYKMVQDNQVKFPDFYPNLKSLGFFHAVIGAVPENYKWLANLAGLEGTISQGSKELAQLSARIESDKSLQFITEEVNFIRVFIATHFEKDYAGAEKLIEKMKKSIPANYPLLTFLEVNTMLVSGKPNEAQSALNGYRPDKNSYQLFYLNYLSGMLKLHRLEMDASGDFKVFLSSFKGKSFVKSAWHKLAWISLLKNDTAGYNQNIGKVKMMGDDFTDEDKQALKEANSKILPNIFLLRCRLLFDGGNYNAALEELAGKPSSCFPTYKDQLEFTYRLARIFDKRGQTDKAIQYYTATYSNGMRSEFYFAANAALNIRTIYENSRDKDKAIQWYKKCLNLRNHEYQNSIDQKAEAGLNRLVH